MKKYILETVSKAYPEGHLIFRDDKGEFWHGGTKCKVAVFNSYDEVKKAVRKIRREAKDRRWYPLTYNTYEVE